MENNNNNVAAEEQGGKRMTKSSVSRKNIIRDMILQQTVKAQEQILCEMLVRMGADNDMKDCFKLELTRPQGGRDLEVKLHYIALHYITLHYISLAKGSKEKLSTFIHILWIRGGGTVKEQAIITSYIFYQ